MSCRAFKVEIGSSRTFICSCHKPQLYHMPCQHAIVVAGARRWDYSTFVSPYYSIKLYQRSYANMFHVIPEKVYWPPFDEAEAIIPLLPPVFRRRAGRLRSTRFRNTMDEPRRSTERACKACGLTDHNSVTCPNRASSSRAANLIIGRQAQKASTAQSQAKEDTYIPSIAALGPSHRAAPSDQDSVLVGAAHLHMAREWPRRFIYNLYLVRLDLLRHLLYVRLDHYLIAALVERWCPSTNTFH
ncbi:hypothetical protein M5K25_014702 [Dendrobium thyrsiflorum]|uniref:SWIM-type domain-containing protein n=1 Tax=Dendrobium thyrsiflorum TaxID=117978 RepID=A0ABD0UNE1_DENTH